MWMSIRIVERKGCLDIKMQMPDIYIHNVINQMPLVALGWQKHNLYLKSVHYPWVWMWKKDTDKLLLFMCIEIPATVEINGLWGAGIDFLGTQDFPTGV